MKKTDRDKNHETAIARYGSTPYTPFLNIPNMIETLPAKYTENYAELSNSEFTAKFTNMLETVSRQKFTPNTKRKISNEVGKVGNILRGIIDAVRDNGKESESIDTITH